MPGAFTGFWSRSIAINTSNILQVLRRKAAFANRRRPETRTQDFERVFGKPIGQLQSGSFPRGSIKSAQRKETGKFVRRTPARPWIPDGADEPRRSRE